MSQATSASVVIPTYNRSRFLPQAIDSCLGQRREGFAVEVVVVDDGSTDDTPHLLGQYGGQVIVLTLGTNQGRNRARNAGLTRASGEFVKFLDSDDFLEPDTLSREAAAATEHHADVVVTGFRVVQLAAGGAYEPVRVHAPPTMEPLVDRLLQGQAVPTSAALYRRSYLRDLWWDESLCKLDDWDWFIRACLRQGKIVALPHAGYSWCQHEGQGIRSTSLLQNAREHHVILGKLERTLADSEELTDARRKRLAQYYYKELRVLCLHDRPAFEAGVERIFRLDPAFQPVDEEPKRALRLLCRVLGMRRALLLHTRVKLAYYALTGRRGQG
jgi:glycosyltransferase involved in cell wall biosynthesis